MEQIPESKPEKIISREQVFDVLRSHLEGKKFNLGKSLEDEFGLVLLEVLCQEPDGSVTEYTFQRKSTRTGKEIPPAIHSARFEDDMPVGDGPLQHYF